MRLIDVSRGRDNNLNLIRIIAATAVLWSHSYVLSTGRPSDEPWVGRIGMTPGHIAVDVFFLASGFLVTASLVRSQSVVDFTIARALRIFPGLLVMLALSAFVLGPLMTTLPLQAYFESGKLYAYLARCGTLFYGVAYELPGVFADNPYKVAVNGSLWTLPHEVRMYAILALAWLALAWAPRRFFAGTCVLAPAASGAYLLAMLATGTAVGRFPSLFFMFFTGAAVFFLRAQVWLSGRVAAALAAALAVALVTGTAFTAVYLLALPYLTLYLAYVPGGIVRQYNSVGDFSYGVYIYAFPLQQAVAALVPGVGPMALFALSGIATLVAAILSWRLIEKPALDAKGAIVGRWKRLEPLIRPAAERP